MDSADLSSSQEGVVSIVNYWERKRLSYNVWLLLSWLSPVYLFDTHTDRYLDFFLAVVIANIFFSMGPYTNILGITKFRAKVRPWGFLYYLGLIVSVKIMFDMGYQPYK